MKVTNEFVSSLTGRYQITIPAAIRRTLKLGKRDKIRSSVQRDGSVFLRRVPAKDSPDPVLGHFLDFLARDVDAHPERLRAVNTQWLRRIKSLVRDVKIGV